MKSWVVFILVFFCCSKIVAQENRASTSIGVTRFDYFHSFDFSQRKNKWEVSTGIAYGINRTLFQQRIFPKIQLQAEYDFIHQQKFECGSTIYGAFSWLKVNKSSKYFTNWSEIYGGVSWSYGRKWRIGQTITAGYFREHYFNTIQQRKMSVGNWGYYFNLKLIYVL